MQLIEIHLRHASRAAFAGKCSTLFLCVFIFLLGNLIQRTVDINVARIFDRRCRKVEPGKTPYQLVPDTLVQNESIISIDLSNKDTGVLYTLQLTVLKDNTFRLHVNEKNPLHPRYETEYSLQDQPQTSKLTLVEKTTDHITITNEGNKVILYANPFRIDLYSQDVLVISANARGLMRFEHHRLKPKYVPLSNIIQLYFTY